MKTVDQAKLEGLSTHTNGKGVVVHNRAEVLPRAVTVTRQKTAGGYWNGSRIYIGVHDEQEVFIVSVPDSGEGTAKFNDWLMEQGMRVKQYITA